MHVLHLEDKERARMEEKGQKILAQKKVAVVTLAGGVGTRLGFKGPKGLFKIESGGKPLSLFERQSCKIEKTIPWIIMVSPKTKSETLSYVQSTLCKEREHVYIIEQEEIEALDTEENPLYSAEGEPILMPNGNGSVFQALQKQGCTKISSRGAESIPTSALDELKAQGIECLNMVSVDNVLVRIADPCALGYLYEHGLEVVSAGVKIEKGAQMGLFIKHQSTVHICEYIDTPKGEALSSQGALLGNIANHIARIDFLCRVDPAQLPYHKAIKKIPHAKDPHPELPNGIKRELFIFDGFNLSEKHGVVEYPPTVYEGLKNKEGEKDSISTCIQALIKEEASAKQRH
ncbi:UDP-N-acetylglucosamine/UDP-N-acetylgalactosamine diphosphorylase [Nematocida sp. AWRm77]|nr:UDP-N-acetylglucosamine/UDP-N-acetylgalactosamine diphosphorylase [Nematocida sp. AWRm77]